MIYLVEFEAVSEATGEAMTLRFASDGYTTRPSDTPPNVHFEERVIVPGNFDRAVFSSGRTSGASTVAFGYIELALTDEDPAQALDYLSGLAVDGRRLTIYGLESVRAPWSSRTTVFVGTMDQIEFSWTIAKIRIRDRMAELNKAIQSVLYLGTTTAGGMSEAEGTKDDLKDRPKPLLFGTARNIPAVLANRFDRIYQVSSRALSGVSAVRDRGVALTFQQDYATIAALRGATIPGGQYGTCRALGLFRVATAPSGDVTVDATEGASGQRSAARTARRMLEGAGFVAGVDFVAADFETLHTVNPAEIGIWIGAEETDLLASVMLVLDSIGAYIVPDQLGRFRVGRLDVPSGTGPVIDRTFVLGDETIERLATNDEGRGIPALNVTVQWGWNYLVQPASGLDNANVPSDVKSFVSLECRSAATPESATVKSRHPLAKPMTFNALFANAADADAEAARRMAIYGTRRDRYSIKVKSEMADGLNLGIIATLRLPRFDLQAGKPFVIIGRSDDLTEGITTLELYG